MNEFYNQLIGAAIVAFVLVGVVASGIISLILIEQGSLWVILSAFFFVFFAILIYINLPDDF